MNNTNYLILKNVKFFASLPSPAIKSLAKVASLRQFKPHELIIKEGAPPIGCYIFLSGTASVYSMNNEAGIKHIVGKVSTNSLIGELSVISGERALCSVEAEDDVECLFLDADTFTQLLSSSPSVSQKLLPIVVERLYQLWRR